MRAIGWRLGLWFGLFGLLLVLVARDAGAAMYVNDGGRDALLARTAREDRVPLIVGLELGGEPFAPEASLGAAAAAAQRGAIAAARTSMLDELAAGEAEVYASWDSLPYVAMRVGAAGLRRLEKSASVASIAEDTLAAPVLASAMPHIGADLTVAAGYDGAGQAVVILDTGIQADHPFYGGRVVEEACFSAAGGGVSLCPNGTGSQFGAGAADAETAQCFNGAANICNHGSHVAGIAAGADPGPPNDAPDAIDGVAPGADIIAIQIFSRFNDSGSCAGSAPCVLSWASDQLSALDYVNSTLRLSWDIAAINMSLGGGMYTAACDFDFRKSVIDGLLTNGIATVIAAGNDGWTDAVGAPGCISSAVTVGSINDPGDGVTSFSNMHAVVDLVAPGRLVVSSVTGDSYANFSGTSMATPVVAGAFAVMKAADPGASVADILSDLQATGVTVVDARVANPPGAATGQSVQRLQLDNAVGAIVSDCGNGSVELGESCDGAAAGACPTGVCDPDCTCEDPVCGNDIIEEGEQCDGTEDAACPGLCVAPGGSGECVCPDPDSCVAAREVDTLPYSDALVTIDATVDPDDPLLPCGAGGQQAHSVWYRFTAPGSATYVVDTFGSTYDTVLAVMTGSCGAFTVHHCNDDTSTLQSQIVFTATAGQTYYIEVTSFSSGAGGVLLLHLAQQAPPPTPTALPTPTPNPLACPTDVDQGCHTGFAKGRLLIKADQPGSEKLVAKLLKGPALAQADMGNPLVGGGTAYSLCIYDGVGSLAGELVVDAAGGFCGKPCWKSLGGDPPNGKGYRFTGDPFFIASDGISKILYKGGDAGKSKLIVKGSGSGLPNGIALGLQASTSATVQMRASDADCLSVTLDDITKQEAGFFKAK